MTYFQQKKGPKYLQLYFYDTEHELENRARFFSSLYPKIISTLRNVLECNPYANFFRSLRELDISEESKIMLKCNVGSDQRVFNAASAFQVAAIWLDGDVYESRHMIAFGKSGKSHRVYHYYGCYDPL